MRWHVVRNVVKAVCVMRWRIVWPRGETRQGGNVAQVQGGPGGEGRPGTVGDVGWWADVWRNEQRCSARRI